MAVARPDTGRIGFMPDDLGGGYGSRLPEDQRDELTPVNARRDLRPGQAVAHHRLLVAFGV